MSKKELMVCLLSRLGCLHAFVMKVFKCYLQYMRNIFKSNKSDCGKAGNNKYVLIPIVNNVTNNLFTPHWILAWLMKYVSFCVKAGHWDMIEETKRMWTFSNISWWFISWKIVLVKVSIAEKDRNKWKFSDY